MKLTALEDYKRTTLPQLIPNVIKGKKIFNIYQIKGYEFIKLTEISKE